MKKLEEIIEEFRKLLMTNSDLDEVEPFIRQAYTAGIEAALEARPKFDYDDPMYRIKKQALQAYENAIKSLLKE